MIGLTIDPGKSNGICLWEAGGLGFLIIDRWQFSGGADALSTWLDVQMLVGLQKLIVYSKDSIRFKVDRLVVEKFTPHENEGFKLTVDAVEPLVCEGVLIAHKLRPFIQWAQPAQQYFIGSSEAPKKEKLKAARRFLQTHHMLPSGTEFGTKDADDAVSATLHSIAYLRRIRHMPTMLQLFDN